ncbi:MAG: sulfatase [Planctomycetota bacterium]
MRMLYLDLDTLRPDHLSCYGYHRNTSPTIDRICSEGMRFDNFYCTDAPCLPGRAAMMSGQFGIHNGVINHGGACADRLPDGKDRGFSDYLRAGGYTNIMRRAGLRTAYIGGFGERHSAYWYYAGFREIIDTGLLGHESAEHVTPSVLDWIGRNGSSDNWYLHVNYWDPHTPYRAPAEFGNPFENEPLPDWMTDEQLERDWLKAGPHSAQDFGMYNNKTNPNQPRQPGEVRGRDGFRQAIDGYDCGIRYMDGHIGRIFDALEAQGVLDDLVVIVSSDHGENLGELGIYGEHGTADQITCRIPMIIRWPGRIKKGAVAKGIHGTIDLCPTLAEMLGVSPHPKWDGVSFAGTLSSDSDSGRSDLVLSQNCHVCQRSVRWGDWLYIRTYHDGYHLFPKEQVFNIKTDPHEQFDIAQVQPELVKEGAWRLMNWHDEMMATMPDGRMVDPMRIVLNEGGPFHARGHLKSYIKRLEDTGRGHAIEELRRRHPREFAS